MKYPIATTYGELIGESKKLNPMSEKDHKLRAERLEFEQKQHEVWLKDRAEQGFFRLIEEPSDEAKELVINEELNLLRRRLESAEYDPKTKRYAIDPDEHEKENRYQKISRLVDHQYYHDERIEKSSRVSSPLRASLSVDMGEHARRAVQEAKGAVHDVLYDLSSLVFALKMCAAKSDGAGSWVYDEILEVLDKKHTEIDTIPSNYTTQNGFNSFAQATPATYYGGNSIGHISPGQVVSTTTINWPSSLPVTSNTISGINSQLKGARYQSTQKLPAKKTKAKTVSPKKMKQFKRFKQNFEK